MVQMTCKNNSFLIFFFFFDQILATIISYFYCSPVNAGVHSVTSLQVFIRYRRLLKVKLQPQLVKVEWRVGGVGVVAVDVAVDVPVDVAVDAAGQPVHVSHLSADESAHLGHALLVDVTLECLRAVQALL